MILLLVHLLTDWIVNLSCFILIYFLMQCIYVFIYQIALARTQQSTVWFLSQAASCLLHMVKVSQFSLTF